MTSLSRKKSVKNIILRMQNQQKQLKIDQLKTEPTQTNKIEISLQKLYHKYGNVQKQKIVSQQVIKNMVTKLYDSNLIFLDNEIQCNQKKEYLKRFYYEWQYQQKISLLGDYYKFHNDQPRIFHEDLHQIVSLYQQDKRQLQYQNVKEKIQQQKQNKGNHPQENQINKVSSNNNLLKPDSKTQKCQFILKDLLNAYDSENKRNKNQKQKQKNNLNQPKAVNFKKQRILTKTNSLNSKKMFSSKSQHHKFKENVKNDNKIFTIKNAQQKELNNLQSKYTQIISEMFKKKRSSSKFTTQIKKTQNKLLQKSHKGNEQKNRVISSRQDKNSLSKSKKNETIKVVRSKSQSHMNFIQPHTFSKPYECKISSRFISVKPIKLSTIKTQKNNKNYPLSQSSKRQKNSSNQSKKDRQSSIISRQDKTVRVFQITKKDLIQESIQNQPLFFDKDSERKQGKQNEGNEILNKQQKSKEKIKQIIKQSRPLKVRKQVKQPNNKQMKQQLKGSSMFSRVIKNKIRS